MGGVQRSRRGLYLLISNLLPLSQGACILCNSELIRGKIVCHLAGVATGGGYFSKKGLFVASSHAYGGEEGWFVIVKNDDTVEHLLGNCSVRESLSIKKKTERQPPFFF